MLRNDNERELQLYLFEKVLLVFKENKESARSRLAKTSTLSLRKKRHGSLQAKSKILTTKLVATLNRSETRPDDRKWLLEVQYRGEKGVEEQFLLRFSNHEKLRLWEEAFNKLIRRHNLARQIPLSRSCSHIVRNLDSDEDDITSDASFVHGILPSDSSFDHVRFPISPPPSNPTSPIAKSIRQGPSSRQNNYGVHQRKMNGTDVPMRRAVRTLVDSSRTRPRALVWGCGNASATSPRCYGAGLRAAPAFMRALPRTKPEHTHVSRSRCGTRTRST